MVLVLEPTGDCEVVLDPIDCDLGMPAEQGLSHLRNESICRSPGFQKKSSSSGLEENKTKTTTTTTKYSLDAHN